MKEAVFARECRNPARWSMALESGSRARRVPLETEGFPVMFEHGNRGALILRDQPEVLGILCGAGCCEAKRVGIG